MIRPLSLALMRPTETAYNMLVTTQNNKPQDDVIVGLTKKIFSLTILFFTLPPYCLGYILHKVHISLNRTNAPITDDNQAQITSNRTNAPIADDNQAPLHQIFQPFQELQSESIDRANLYCQTLENLYTNPTKTAYYDLHPNLKYLIAGRHTRNTWFWFLRSKFGLMKELEKDIRAYNNLGFCKKAISEAIQTEKKILFTYIFQESVRQRLDVNALERDHPHTFKQCLYYIAREDGCTKDQNPEEEGRKILESSNYKKIEKGISSFLLHLKDAYTLNELPSMNDPNQNESS